MRGLVCEEASTSILSVTEMHLPVTKNDASVTEKDMPLPRDEHDRASSTLLRRQERMLKRLTEIGKLEDRVLVVDALARVSGIPSEIAPQGHHLGDGQVPASIDDRSSRTASWSPTPFREASGIPSEVNPQADRDRSGLAPRP